MAAYKRFARLAAVVVRQRAREQSLRHQISSARPFAAGNIQLFFSTEEAALLALFDGLSDLNRRNPRAVAATADLVRTLWRAGGTVRGEL